MQAAGPNWAQDHSWDSQEGSEGDFWKFPAVRDLSLSLSVQQGQQGTERRRDNPGPGPGLLCCLPARKQKKDTAMDRVEAAFRKFDSDGDGYIDWEEFKQVKGGSVSPISL